MIVPPSVVLTRRDNAARNNQVAITTVIDGKETTITQSGILVTRVSPFRALLLYSTARMAWRGKMAEPGPRFLFPGGLSSQSRFSTLADGQVSTVTSIVAIPNVTVSFSVSHSVVNIPGNDLRAHLTLHTHVEHRSQSRARIVCRPVSLRPSFTKRGVPDPLFACTAYVTTTLTDGLVAVVRTATALQTETATVTYTASNGKRRHPAPPLPYPFDRTWGD